MAECERSSGVTADVIVVGSGPAGCVVTRRLADAGVDVLLLEAGGDDTNTAISDPTRLFELIGGPDDWGYASVAQGHANDRVIDQPRGKVVGGCSSINGMIYARGHTSDFDTWAYLGNAGWAYNDVLPLFKRYEDFDDGASAYRGAGGPLHILSRYKLHPVVADIIAAAEQAGIAPNPDYNAERVEGVAPIQFMIKDGVRQSAWRAFVKPVLGAENVKVRTGCHVRRVLLAGERCVGVEVLHGGSIERLTARHEVVLTAGAFDSPKLLMLSGIGPERELTRFGVEVHLQLPGVGQNLQDHIFAPLVYAAKRVVPPMLTGIMPSHGTLFWHSRSGLVGPDIQALLGHLPRYPPGYSGPRDGFSLHAMLTRPASRGSVGLGSADPAAPPRIDPAYLSCSADVDAIAAGIELLREVAGQDAVEPWRGPELFPGSAVTAQTGLRDYVRTTFSTIFHPTGTCKMGVDRSAVVDPSLRVHGIEGLRVADASVMPLITSANTQAPTMMIGERAADNILDDLGIGGARAQAEPALPNYAGYAT